MDPYLALLVPIAGLDDQLADVTERIGRAERKLSQATDAVASCRKELERLEAEITALRRTERAQQTELERLDNLRTSARRALDAGMGDPAVAERQITRCDELADVAETTILEAMETRETREAQRQTATVALAQAEERLAAAHTEHDPTIVAWKIEVKRLNSERAPLVADLPRDVGGTYKQLLARKGSALALSPDGVCSACSRVVPLKRQTEVKQGRLVTCDGCGRWLYVHPSAEAPPA